MLKTGEGKKSRTRSATGEVGHFRCLEFEEELVIHPILLSHPDTIDKKLSPNPDDQMA
jgi:hypothetical protein